MSVNLRSTLAGFAAVICVLGAQPAAAAKIGVAGAVRNIVTDGGSGQKLSVGSQLFEQQVVKTGDASAAQLIFLDETSMSLGPKAQVKLDKFVYDPSKKAGNVVLSATKGAFRFVSGGQDPRSYTIKTPVATIGVRGTIVDSYPVNGGWLFIVQQGLAIINGQSVKAGQAYFVSNDRHHSTGPFTPDGHFFAVLARMPFPLFGQDLAEVIQRFDIADNSTTDILDLVNSRNEPPPPDLPPEPPPKHECDWGDYYGD